MRYRFGRLALGAALLSAALPVQPTCAQNYTHTQTASEPRGGPFLLSTPELRKELKLSAQQDAKVDDALRALAKTYQAGHAALVKVPPAERPARQWALVKSLIAAIKTKLEFTSEQSRRFDQIMLQHRRFDAFLDPEIAAKLMLKDRQKDELIAIQARKLEQIRALRLKIGGNRVLLLKRVAEVSREMTTEAVELLSPEQATVWKGLVGKPFEPPAPPEP
jgi:hypothetical protein